MSKKFKSMGREFFAVVKHTGSLRNHPLELYNVTEIKHSIGHREEGGKPRLKIPYKPRTDIDFNPVSLYELKTAGGANDRIMHTYRVYIIKMSESREFLEQALATPKLREEHLKVPTGLEVDISEEETDTETDDRPLRTLQQQLAMAKGARVARQDQHISTVEKLTKSGQLDLSANLSEETGNGDAWRLVQELKDQLEKQKQEAAMKEIETEKLLEEAKRKQEETKRKEEELRKKEEAILSLGGMDLTSLLQSVHTFRESASRLERLETDVTFIKEKLSKYNLKKQNYIWEWLMDVPIAHCK